MVRITLKKSIVGSALKSQIHAILEDLPGEFMDFPGFGEFLALGRCRCVPNARPHTTVALHLAGKSKIKAKDAVDGLLELQFQKTHLLVGGLVAVNFGFSH